MTKRVSQSKQQLDTLDKNPDRKPMGTFKFKTLSEERHIENHMVRTRFESPVPEHVFRLRIKITNMLEIVDSRDDIGFGLTFASFSS